MKTRALILVSALSVRCGLAATVTTTADSGPGSLREAIASAAPAETIIFSTGDTITLTSGELLIDKDLILSGPGADNLVIQRSTDSATPDFRVFNVLSGTVRISGLRVSNGRATVGGGIFNQSDLILQDCVLTGNVAATAGGGLMNLDSMTISNCVILGNSVTGAAGEGFGGGLYNDGMLTAINSLVSSNSVTSGTGDRFGGGIYNDGTLTLSGLVVQGNSVAADPDDGAGYGGGLDNELGTVTMNNSTVSHNVVRGSAGGGGGFNNGFGTVYVNNSTVSGNVAQGGAGSGGGFGGGFNNGFGTLYVATSAVSGNVARGGAGSAGGLGQGGGVANGSGTVALDRSTVSGNLAVGGEGGSGGWGEGGGIANIDGTVYVDSSTVSGNTSLAGPGSGGGSARGGGIFNDFGAVNLAYSTVASNAVPGGFLEDGGGIFNLEGAVQLQSTVVAANTATVDLFNGEFGNMLSGGFNVIGSTRGPFTVARGDQTGVTAAGLHLGPLQANGGPTFTHALLCGSPALDAGDNTNAPATDQRGFPRIVGGIIDIGAFEANTNAPPVISCPNPITLNCAPPAGQAATLSVTVADAEGDPLMVVWSVNGTAHQTNAVAGGSPTAAQVDFTAVFAVGSHQVTVSVADPGGCSATCAAVLVTVHPNPPPPNISANGPLSFCPGGSVTLTSSSATGNVWSTGATTPSIIVSNAGSYTVTVTDANGCSATSAAVSVTMQDCPGNYLFLLIDEDCIDNASPGYALPANTGHAKDFVRRGRTFGGRDVNDDLPRLAQRAPLRFFNNPANFGRIIVLRTGQVGDEGIFAMKEFPNSWTLAGPSPNGLRNFIGDPHLPFPHHVGRSLGTGNDPEKLLDKIPRVTPLRARALRMLQGSRVCGLVWDSDISINYGPLNGNLQGEKLGVVAFEVLEVRKAIGFSSSTLPLISIRIVDPGEAFANLPSLFLNAPEPKSSSTPFDTDPGP